MTLNTRRRRLGDRRDGYRLRGLDPLMRLIPFVMNKRAASINYMRDTLITDSAEAYIAKQRGNGMKGFGLMHLLIATYIRTVATRPALNRFVAGQHIYARNSIEIMFNIKRDMTLESPETVLKIEFAPDATVDDVYTSVRRHVEEYRTHPENSVDEISAFLGSMPRCILRVVVFLMRVLDYYGILPASVVKTSPFHGSMYMTSTGSLGTPPVMHHLYEFGNVPLFLSFGTKRFDMVVDEEGNPRKVRCVDIAMSVDERICDGFYLASAFKQMRRIMRNPEVLETPPSTFVVDPDIEREKKV